MAASDESSGSQSNGRKPTKIFISYARADQTQVEKLAVGLERAGHEVWWDRQIGGGAEFAREIEAALADSDVVAVAWSKHSVDSHWVRDEAAAGRDSGRLLPLSLDGSMPPLGFRQFQTTDLSRFGSRDTAAKVQAVLDALGSRSPQTSGKGTGAKRSKLRRWIAAFAAAGLAGAISVAAVLYWPSSSPALAPPELEIAALKSLAPQVEPHFVEQLHQELRTALATDSAIAVKTSEAEDKPEARFALSATVNRTADDLKLAAELSDRESGVTLWSKMFELPAHEPDLVPRQAAYKVATVVRCALTSRSKELDAPALAQWTNLCDELWGNPNGTMDRLLTAARNATEAAPNFSEAWSARAMAAAPLPGQTAHGDIAELRREAEEAADRALQLDPENGEAYAAKSFLVPQRDYATREALLKTAVSVRPTDCICQEIFYGQFLMSVGRIQEAYEHYRRAHELRPLAPVGSNGMAHALFLLGRDDDARAVLADARKLWPDDHGLKMLQLRSSIWTGNYDEGLALLRDPQFKVPQPRREPWLTALSALKSNDRAQRDRAVRTVVAATKKPGWNNMVAISALAKLGAKEESLDAARRFIGENGVQWSMVLFEPTLAEVRQTSEFARLVQQIGMSRYWAGLPHGPDFCRFATSTPCRAL